MDDWIRRAWRQCSHKPGSIFEVSDVRTQANIPHRLRHHMRDGRASPCCRHPSQGAIFPAMLNDPEYPNQDPAADSATTGTRGGVRGEIVWPAVAAAAITCLVWGGRRDQRWPNRRSWSGMGAGSHRYQRWRFNRCHPPADPSGRARSYRCSHCGHDPAHRR